jgi:hypothetical protein
MERILYKNRFFAWGAVHLLAIAIWMRIASPLWQLTAEERCPDFGDSLYLLIWVFPGLGLGLLSAGWGLTYSYISRNRFSRNGRIPFWILIFVAWVVAACIAYFNIRRDASLPCVQ